MADRPTTRQELYDRIRESSKDEVILEEMVRLGFWPAASGLPEDPAEDIRREGELSRKVRALATEQARLHNVEAMKKEARRRRMQAARERRVETQRKREAARQERAQAWRARSATEVLYLGDGVSNTLGRREETVADGLPSLPDAAAIAAAMGIDLGELRFLAFHRRVSQTTHYRRFEIPKKTGGTRLISAPMPRLKAAQRWVLTAILEPVPLHDAAHGFVSGRSIVTNAAAHVGQPAVVNLDLRNFFPTLTYPRVRGVFRSLGYSPEAATILALVCTEPEVQEVELDGRTWFVHQSERHLPQGSPASPAITNIVCRKLDLRLAGLAHKLGLTYTRYADDLTFSGPADRICTVLKAVPAIVADEGFEVHPGKTRVMRRGSRQEVTGLVVNERLGVPRRFLRRFRAVVRQVRLDGPTGKSFGPGTDVLSSLAGFAAFVHMVDTDRGAGLIAEVRAAAEAHGWKPPKRRVYEAGEPSWVAKKRAAAAARAVDPAEATTEPAGSLRTSAQPEAPGDAASSPGDSPTNGEGKPKWWEFWKWLT